jgi:hypothetical protein
MILQKRAAPAAADAAAVPPLVNGSVSGNATAAAAGAGTGAGGGIDDYLNVTVVVDDVPVINKKETQYFIKIQLGTPRREHVVTFDTVCRLGGARARVGRCRSVGA